MTQDLITHYYLKKKDREGYPVLKNNVVNYFFSNLIRAKKGFEFIDPKWEFKKELPIDFILFRSLYWLYDKCKAFIKCKDFPYFCCKIISQIYPHFNLKRLQKLKALEEEFQSDINQGKVIIEINVPPEHSLIELASLNITSKENKKVKNIFTNSWKKLEGHQ